jgi:porin
MDYSALVYRGVRLSPNVQYVVNPDNSAIPKISYVPKNALIFGLKLTVNVAAVLGLPQAPALSD